MVCIGTLWFLMGCDTAPTLTPTPSAPASITPAAASPSQPTVTIRPTPTAVANETRFNLNATQAELVHTIISFVQAYNGGRVEEALALLDDKIVGSDCDYTRVTTVFFKGKQETETWLRQRKADADQLTIDRILNENPGETHVAGVTFARRTSNSLRRLGFAEGITPKLAAKVVVYYEPTRIIGFANGPGGGDPNNCRA
jgi:hypothetical protein